MALTLAQLLLVALCFTADPRTPVPAPRAEREPLIAWQELADHPLQWLGRTVRVQVQMHGALESWNPYMTRFGPKQFSAYQAWSDEQFPWVRAEYESPTVRAFTLRDGASDFVLQSATKHARFEVRVVVREVFLDLPWIEVLDVKPLQGEIGEGTLIHASRGVELAQGSAWNLAQDQFEQALAGPLPARARTELEQHLAECKEHLADENALRGLRESVRQPLPRKPARPSGD